MSTFSADDPADETSRFDQQLTEVESELGSRLWSKSFGQLLVIQFLFGLGFSTFYLLPKYLHQVYGANAATIGKVTGVALLAAVAATPLAATWVGRGKRRMPAFAALALLAASAVAFAFVDHVGWFMATLRIAQGTAFCLFMTAIVTKATEIVPSGRLGQAIGYLGLAALVTNALSPVVAEPLAEQFGWPAVFSLAALWCVAASCYAWKIADSPSATTPQTLCWNLLLSAPLRSIFYAAMTCGVALGVMFTYTQPLALLRGARHVGVFFSGYALFAASVRLLIGDIADRFGRKWVCVAATVGYALVMALTAWVTPHTLFWCGAGLGIAHGVLYPALNALAFEMSKAESRGLVAAAFSGSFCLGYALSVLSLGFVADIWGLPVVFIGTSLFTVTGAWVLVSVRGVSAMESRH
jgi:MFS family permease